MTRDKCIKLVKWLTPTIVILGNILQYTETTQWFSRDKDHWLNVIFVKRGWFWTTLAIIMNEMFMIRRNRGNRTRIIKQYLLILGWWFIFTQGIPIYHISEEKWSLGAPLMDLVFTYSGGSCSYDVFDDTGSIDKLFHGTEVHDRRLKSINRLYKWLTKLSKPQSSIMVNAITKLEHLLKIRSESSTIFEDGTIGSNWNNEITKEMEKLDELAIGSSAKCRQFGGYWQGGHDPSGHVFLLTSMIILIISELHETHLFRSKINTKWFLWQRIARILCWLLISMWSFSLLVTCTLYHTPLEKAAGFLSGYIVSIYAVRLT